MIDVIMPSERFKNREEDIESHPLQLSKVLDSSNQDKSVAKMAEGNKQDETGDDYSHPMGEETPDLSRSTFAALEHMKKKGLFEKRLSNVYAGRKNDQKLHTRDEHVEAETDEDGLKLERRDKEGNLMNRKQAFRYICWGFHNKKPSKLKRAKMEKKIKAEKAVRFPSLRLFSRILISQ